MTSPACVDLSLPGADAIVDALRARRNRAAASFEAAGLAPGLVCLAAGVAIPVEGTDGFYGFRCHDDHLYLSGSSRSAGVLLFDPAAEVSWTLFVAVADAADRIWHGDSDPLALVASETGLEAVRPLSELESVLSRQVGRPTAVLGNYDLLASPSAYELHPGVIEALDLDADRSDALEATLHQQRRTKDAVELDWMRAAAVASRAGHEVGMRLATPGMTEIALRIEIEAAFLRAGGTSVAYPSIVAGGTNAAVLHATPGARVLGAGDLVLVDAGAEVRGYDADVTRTYPASGTYSPDQAALYDAVLNVHQAAIADVRAGVEYHALHLAAAHRIAEGLVGLGVLQGAPAELVERDAHAVFFPHGLGHMIGLATHDVASRVPGREPSTRPGLKNLRMDLPLEPGYVVTIEPGIYFIDALVHDEATRETFADCVDWDRVEALLPLGGVRIEDDVLVTDGAAEVLTVGLPTDRAAIEALCSA